jgi:branched-chain amino acid transport system substrate-binding protein
MRTAVALRFAVIITVGCALAGCSPLGDALARDQEAGPRTAKIVVMGPPDGASAAGVLPAVQLAVQDRELAIPGWTVDVVAVDDTDADTAAEALTEDPEVIAVVGGLSGPAVRASQPLLADASILFVSPADVAPEHTRGADPAAPLRPYPTYFRTAVTGVDAIATAANYAVSGLDADLVAIVDGGGSDEAARFAAEVRRLGSEVVDTTSPGADRDRIAQAVETATAANAEVVYTAGNAALAAQVAKTLAGTGVDATLVGGPALRSEDFITVAGTAAEGAVAVVDPLREDGPATAAGDLAARLAEQGVDDPGSYSAAAYDAGTAIAETLSGCLSDKDSVVDARAGCVAQMTQVSFVGVSGEVAFDAFGDRAGVRPQVFQVRDGAWIELGSA